MLFSNSLRSSTVKMSISLIHPSVLSSSSPSSPSHSSHVTNSSISRPSASSRSSLSTSSSTALAFFPGTSNCFNNCLAIKFTMCRKHHVRFGAPGKFGSKFTSSLIIVSLFDALLQVMLRIYDIGESCINIIYSS